MVRSVGKEGTTSGSDFIIRKRLSEVGGLRTITEIMAEKGPKATHLMKNLTNVIEVKKRRLEAMESKYMEIRETSKKLLAENDKLNRLYCGEMKEMQFSIREHFQWICNDHEEQSSKIDRKQRQLELRSIKLQKREAVNKNKRRKLAKVIKEIAISSSLHEKRKEKLVDDHKREMVKLHQKILFLEKQLNPKQALEDLRKKLNEKEEELVDLKTFTQFVSVKERSSNDELQEACKALIKEVIDEEDIKLKRLKTEVGDEVYKVVTTALMDINNYNPDKKEFREELWNFAESRKATLKEGVCCLLKMCDRATHEAKPTLNIYSRRNPRAM